ncbi:MAG: hypothetical protein WBD31_17010 [Rubripirellula sp.]
MFSSFRRTAEQARPSNRAQTGQRPQGLPALRRVLTVAMAAWLVAGPMLSQWLIACPFCNAVSQTIRQEMAAMDAVVIATATQSDLTRDKDTGEVSMKVDVVLKGTDHVTVGSEVRAIYYGDVSIGRRFMLSGVDPPNLQWSCLPVNERAEKYVKTVAKMAEEDPLKRLRYYYDFLQDDESMLARDAYDEFAITPYPVVKALAPEMDHDQLVEWISDTETSTDRKRLFLTMLGACGDEKDLPMLEEMLRSTQKSTRGGLDALIACYLTLGGEKGLPLIDELFLNNKNAPYADTYAAIMAVRFHGTEGDVIQRSALVESLHHVLERTDLADLVIPDLARWSDWSQIDRLKDLFINADPDNNWVRVPVVNYLRACPLPAAKEALEKLEEVDPESVKRANTFFSIPVPARDTTGDGTSVERQIGQKFAMDQSVAPLAIGSGPIAAAVPVAAAIQPMTAAVVPLNPWRLASVLLMAISTVVIAQLLLLSGGADSVRKDSV